jgi:transketolase
MLVTPGLEMSTGSLGQGLSVGIGIALGARLLGKDFHTYVLIGDGESQEGQVWEAAAVAARYGLDNLTAILDWNYLQQYGWHRPGDPQSVRQPPEADPVAKWQAFGWETIETDGHDVAAVVAALNKALATRGRPAIVIARTVKGKGVSFMEGNYLWHASPLSDAQAAAALAELGVEPAPG